MQSIEPRGSAFQYFAFQPLLIKARPLASNAYEVVLQHWIDLFHEDLL